MTGTDPRVADLERQVADLTVLVELADQALTLKTVNQMSIEVLRYDVGDCASLKPSRPRHLMAVQGGRR